VSCANTLGHLFFTTTVAEKTLQKPIVTCAETLELPALLFRSCPSHLATDGVHDSQAVSAKIYRKGKYIAGATTFCQLAITSTNISHFHQGQIL
jgi:hypothetical protein